MTEYVYPSDIRDTKYENRKLTIKIKQKTITQTATDGYNQAIDKIASAASLVQVDSSSFNAMKINLDANSKSKNDLTSDIIVLPLPNTFSDSQDHGWDRESGVMGSIGKSFLETSGSDAVKSLTSVLPQSGKTGIAANAINAIGKHLKSSLDQALGSASAQAGMRKPIFDPGYFQNYNGSAPRTFNVAWDFVPRSAAEASDIMMIIMKLKQYTSPTTIGGGVSLLAPHYLSIEFNNPFITTMIKLDRVVVSNLSVDYGADGAMQQTADGMPKHITMTMTLQEVDMTTADDYTTQPELVKTKSRTTLQTTTPTGG